MAAEMELKCLECKNWNEHWYWTHLEPNQIRFSRLLTAGFDQRLVVPRKIISMFREQFENRVILKNQSGKAWTIGLKKRDDEFFFQKGWADFARGHSLKKGDILIFQFEKASTFAVSMFDGKTGYEKVGSCFNHGHPTNWKTRETNVHVEYSSSMNNSSDDNISLERGRSGRRKVSPANERIETETKIEDHTQPRKKARMADSRAKISLRSTALSNSSKGKSVCKEPNSIGTGKRIINLKTYPMYFVSRRRSVHPAEKDKAYQHACAFQSCKPIFTVTMVPTSVTKKFFMAIPQIFVREHIPGSLKEVVLSVPPVVKTWVVTLAYSGKSRKHGVGLGAGWMSFVWDNNLEEDDVCVFELTQSPGNKKIKTFAMDVYIFRVVRKLTQLTRASRQQLMKGEEINAAQ